MSAVQLALRRNEWEKAALYLLLGVARAAEKLPPESLTALLEVLGGEERKEGRRGR